MRAIVAAGLVALIGLWVATNASAAAQFTVTTTSDGSGTGDCLTAGMCGLRQAINAADGEGGGTIIVKAGTYLLSEGPPLSITAPITLQGDPNAPTILDGDHNAQVLNVSSGSLTATDLTIQDAQGGTVDGGGLEVAAGASANLTDDVVTDNSTTQAGGGISTLGNLTLDDDLVEGNAANGAATYGGGIYVGGTSGQSNTVTITNTTISANQAGYGGGGIMEEAAEVGTNGFTATALIISNSAIVSNQAVVAGGLFGAGGDPGARPTLTMTDTTVADNTAPSNGDYGGVGVGVVASFLNDTIADNSGPGAADLDVTGPFATIQNTIVAGPVSAGPTCQIVDGPIQSLGHNLDSGDSCGFAASGDLVNTDPQLGSLQDNGGPTETMAPALGSPAIDAGASAPLVCPSTDQRGVARPQGSACDIGAYESALPMISAPSITGVSATGVTITGTVANPDLSNAVVSVEWGTSAGSYPNTTSGSANETAGPQTSPTSYSFPLTGLQPASTFHYQVVATSARGTVTSGDQTFTTAPAPAATILGATPAPASTPVPTPTSPVLPSDTFTLSKLKLSKQAKLTAMLGAPDAGTFMAKATLKITVKVAVHKHGKRVIEKRTMTYTYGSATVRATGKGNKALSISPAKAAAKELKKLGKAKITVTVTFTPTGGKAARESSTIPIKRSRKGVFA